MAGFVAKVNSEARPFLLTNIFASSNSYSTPFMAIADEMPLRRRLIILIALVLCLSLLIGGALTYWHAVKKIDVEMTSAITAGESTLKDALASLAKATDPEHQISLMIRSFDDERHLRARFVRSAGTQALTSAVKPPADPPPAWLLSLLAAPPHTLVMELPEQLRGLGRIELQSDSLNEVTEVWDDVTLKLAILASFFGLVLGLVYWTLGQALRPLEDLSKALSRVGRGDYGAHVAETGPTELASIYREFNHMAEQLQAAERNNQRLNDQLSTVQEEERSDIARDLHDEIGPFLFAVDVDAQTIPQILERGSKSDVAERASAIRQSVAHMQSHLRSILSRLKPAVLLDLGLAHAIDHLVSFWRTRHPGITISVDIAQESFGPKLDEVAYRIMQESLSNAVRHGKPSHITLVARPTDGGQLFISVTDNGSGLDPQGLKGFGLAGMRERIAALGGHLSVSNNHRGPGVSVVAEMPLHDQVNVAKATAGVSA